MDSKLNLFDIFGILMPGIAVLFETYLFAVCLGWHSPFAIESLTGSLFLITLGYASGIVLLQLSRMLFRERVLAERMLSDESTTLHPRFKADLIQSIRRRFGPSPGQYGASERQTDFDLCYYDVIQQGKGVYTENFTAMASLHRQMIVVLFIGFAYLTSYLSLNHLLGMPPLWFSAIYIGILIGFALRTFGIVRKTTRLNMTFVYLFLVSSASPAVAQIPNFHIWMLLVAWVIVCLPCQLLYTGWNNYNFYFTLSVYRSFYLLHPKPAEVTVQPPTSFLSHFRKWLTK